MEVQLRPELEETLNELSSQTGRPAGELVQDAITGYLDDLAGTREMLDSRYDDLKSGRVKPSTEKRSSRAFAAVRMNFSSRRANEPWL